MSTRKNRPVLTLENRDNPLREKPTCFRDGATSRSRNAARGSARPSRGARAWTHRSNLPLPRSADLSDAVERPAARAPLRIRRAVGRHAEHSVGSRGAPLAVALLELRPRRPRRPLRWRRHPAIAFRPQSTSRRGRSVAEIPLYAQRARGSSARRDLRHRLPRRRRVLMWTELRSATCSSEGHLCFRCGPRLSRRHFPSRATARRTRTSLRELPFRTSSWRFVTLCPAPRVRSARWRSVPPPRVYSVWRLPPGLPLPRRRAPRAHGRNLVEDEIYDRSRQEITLGNRVPSVAADAWIAPNATLVGDTDVADQCSVWHGSVLKGDLGAVRLGAFSNVQERCVIDAAGYAPTSLPHAFPETRASPNPAPAPRSRLARPRVSPPQQSKTPDESAPPGQHSCESAAVPPLRREIFPLSLVARSRLPSLSLSLSLRAARRRASDST